MLGTRAHPITGHDAPRRSFPLFDGIFSVVSLPSLLHIEVPVFRMNECH